MAARRRRKTFIGEIAEGQVVPKPPTGQWRPRDQRNYPAGKREFPADSYHMRLVRDGAITRDPVTRQGKPKPEAKAKETKQ
jgi:hypothetical protein